MCSVKGAAVTGVRRSFSPKTSQAMKNLKAVVDSLAPNDTITHALKATLDSFST
jgi:hypothetical protein